MSHTVCHDVGSWVESNVQQQVEQCIEQDCDWWCACCNKWLCGLVWVVVNVVSWVVQTVCELVADIVDLVVNVVRGVWDILAGIFTGDWSRIVAGLGEIIGGVVAFVLELIPIVTFGTLVGVFVNSANAWSLRDYARGLLQNKYGAADPDGLKKMLDALGINSGGFGLRLKARALRAFLRSDFSSQRDGTPDLFVMVRDQGLDLKVLAGFNPPPWWDRPWPELVGDSGDVSDTDIDTYILNGGVGDKVKHFSLFSMSKGDLQTRLDTASQHAPEIGLMLDWSIEDTRLATIDEVLINRDAFPSILPEPPFSRHAAGINDPVAAAAATAELCQPIVIGAFGFTEPGAMGISAHLANATCLEVTDGSTLFGGQGITGSAIRNRKPDLGFKYTAIHEMGHTFGLCHVDGILRIMFTNAKDQNKSTFTWGVLWQYWNSGLEASFTLDEGKKVWDYIVGNFSPDCLEMRQF